MLTILFKINWLVVEGKLNHYYYTQRQQRNNYVLLEFIYIIVLNIIRGIIEIKHSLKN